MAEKIATERSPGIPRWAQAFLITLMFPFFGSIGFLAACGGGTADQTSINDGDGRYDYDAAWHQITVVGSDGTAYTCIVNDFKEGVWCK